jgi:FixJ family two-component response regulator
VPRALITGAIRFQLMTDSRKVIAIVDDDPSMLKAIERLLAAHGFAPHTFASAEAFLDSGVAGHAVCLVLDIHLDGMSGLELRRRLNAVRSTLPVIFVTAADDDETQQDAAKAGCIACLRKPFSADLLMNEIGKVTA